MQKILFSILIGILTVSCWASVSTNVPLDHWGYTTIDQLIAYGFIHSDLMTIRPVSRLEMARLIDEAQTKIKNTRETNVFILAHANRLAREFEYEMDVISSPYGTSTASFLKPIEDPYIRYVNARKTPNLENESGDRFREGSSTRLGFSSRGKIADRFAFYVRPEHRTPDGDDRGFNLRNSYGKSALGQFEIQVGKDSLWWGPGYHGSLIMSNHAEPFTMYKVSNPHPILLPGILRRLGPMRGVFFITELEKNRTVSEPKMTGLRLDFKPHPNLQFGVSRTLMFGGKRNGKVGLNDYLQIFRPKNVQDYRNKAALTSSRENQLAGVDVSWRIGLPRHVPIRSVKLYGQYIGEDMTGITSFRPILGAQVNDLFRKGRSDLRIEYAKTSLGSSYPGAYYTHGTFANGYTYKGQVIGHHMGTEARDLFARLTHCLTPDMTLGLEYNRQTHLANDPHTKVDYWGTDITWFGPCNLQLQARYRQVRYQDHPMLSGNNSIFDVGVICDF